MKRNIINQLESLPFFSKSSIATLQSIQTRALYQNLQRWVNTGYLVRLKNGLYVTKTFVDRFLHDASYLELVANKLVMPSYLSLEYVLQKNNLLTEATFTITSVTLKTTRHYRNNLGSFVYHHFNQKFYFGFKQRPYGHHIIYEAILAKALFDFLYLRLAGLDPQDVSSLEGLRINWSQLDRPSFDELCQMILRSGIKKMIRMIPSLKRIY
ncbi:MAG: hypothetical protein HYU97_11235 [Deltaproteobacteria bacterium]|nr:hypothetical protein [Deltaproteobacteria bacterium]